MLLDEIMELDEKYYMHTFGKRTPVAFTHGEGVYLWDTNGKKYTDMFAGIAVNALGHGHPKLVEAIAEQAKRLIHCSNIYYIENQALLAKLLVENSCADRVFFGNSGGEANEAALKIARLYFRKQGKEKYEVITLKNSFHGRTLATLSATGQEKYSKPYAPLMPSFVHVPMNDVAALESAINDKTCAIMLECIQGESGVYPLTKEYVKAAKALCEKHDLLLIFDEVQTGIGRTGKLFGYENYDVEPDIFTLAKALAGGVPIGAVCAKGKVAETFAPGEHGSTFGGNPLACAAGVAVMKVIKEEKLLDNAVNMGAYLKSQLETLQVKTGEITEVRGTGLMIGVSFKNEIAAKVKDKLFEMGFLVNNVGACSLRIVSPLIIDKASIDSFAKALEEAVKSV